MRPETAADAEAVHALHAAAFGRVVEADLYTALRRDGDDLPASRVGLLDGVLVASVVVSRAWVGDAPVAALGPVGVLPEHQGRGYGSEVVRAAVAACAGEPLVALLGSTAFYRRFGFAADPRVTPPDPEWGEHFQVLRNDPSVEGPFRYARAFDAVS
ncbi:MAG TPA: N-acetyltransferase [Frankiaceae bacterium]|nr:N-acetyltransferase [Frankiaceae bacterium]